MRELAELHATTPAAIALAWLLARPEVTSILVGARSVAQIDENLAALQVKLTVEQLAALDEVSTPDWGYPYEFIGRREPW